MNNTAKFYMSNAAYAFATMFSSGAIIQTFLADMELSEGQIAVFDICKSVIQIVVMLLSVFLLDKVKNVLSFYEKTTYPAILFFLIFLPLCFVSDISVTVVFWVSILACSICNMSVGIRSMVSYKMPYYIMDMSQYGKIMATSGIISGILNVAVSALFSLLISVFDYRLMIIIFFILSIIMTFASAKINRSYSVIENAPVPKRNEKFSASEIFREKSTLLLAIPNFLRGMCTGIIGMAAVIMMCGVTRDAALTSALSTVNAAAGIAACYIYRCLSGRVSSIHFCLAGGIIQSLSVVFLLTGSNYIVFYMLYFTAIVGMFFVDYAIPVYVTEIVPFKIVGGYSSVRMLITNAGTTVGTAVAGLMVNSHLQALLIVCAACQLAGTGGYFIYDRLRKR